MISISRLRINIDMAKRFAACNYFASQSSRPLARRNRTHFSHGHVPGEKYFSRSGLRQSKLRSLRFHERQKPSMKTPYLFVAFPLQN
jgi:hypothetical protein